MRHRILVIEDDADIATVLRDRLETMGNEVVTAIDGQAGLEAFEREAPNLLLLDLELPKVNGMDVLRRIRKNSPEVPIVVMTAHGTIARAVEAMKEGATDFITKPFDSDYLKIVMAKALERGELKQEVAVLRAELDSRYETLQASSTKMAGTCVCPTKQSAVWKCEKFARAIDVFVIYSQMGWRGLACAIVTSLL